MLLCINGKQSAGKRSGDLNARCYFIADLVEKENALVVGDFQSTRNLVTSWVLLCFTLGTLWAKEVLCGVNVLIIMRHVFGVCVQQFNARQKNWSRIFAVNVFWKDCVGIKAE